MGATIPVLSSAMPVFNAVSGYFQREDALDQQQALAQQKEALRQAEQQQKLAAEQEYRQRALEQLAAEQSLEATQLVDNQNQDLESATGDLQSRVSQIRAAATVDEGRRRDALRRAMAKTRASLGAAGLGTADGSGEAILLGQVNATDQEQKAAETSNQLKIDSLNQQLEDRYRRNLLAQSQLAERQKLQYLSRLG
ncbi:hypothetical protein CCP2SC5_1050006 [Azospirillaceae bacterium]